jgi:hypothetical protein
MKTHCVPMYFSPVQYRLLYSIPTMDPTVMPGELTRRIHAEEETQP